MSKKTKIRDEADRLMSKIVRARGECVKCGTSRNLQCAHIRSRSYTPTRCDLNNALCLCLECHAHYTVNPNKWTAYVVQTIGEDAYMELRDKSLLSVRATEEFWTRELARLKRSPAAARLT